MKMSRLIGIIMLLLERRTISAAELARTFEVSKRTIYRDIEIINEAGIPIVTFPGTNGGIGIMDEFKVDKRLFSETDLTSLLIGLSSVHSALDSDETRQAMGKLKALIPKEKQSEIDKLTNRIAIDLSPWQKDTIREGYLQIINSAIAERKTLCFDYYDVKGDISCREVEPYRLMHKGNSWYLQGFCLARQEMRTFRFSRIHKLTTSERVFEPREVDLPELSNEVAYDMPQVMVKIRFDETLKGQIISYFRDIDVGHENGKYVATLPVPDGDLGIRFLLSLGESCECLEPLAVRQELIRRVKSMLRLYEQDERPTSPPGSGLQFFSCCD